MFTFYHNPSPYIYWWILIQFHTNVGYDNILSKFNVQGLGLKVKVTVASFRKNKKQKKKKKQKKNFGIALCLHLSMNFNITSYKCWELTWTFKLLGPRSRSLWILLVKKKLCYGSSAYIYWWISILLYMFGIISWVTNFQGDRVKVVVVDIFWKKKKKKKRQWVLIYPHKRCVCNISSKLDFQDAGLKVKVTVAIFRKRNKIKNKELSSV